MDTAILTNSLNQFLTVFNAAYGLIWANGGQALLWVLAGIELVLVALWWALGGNAQTMDVIKKLLFMMFWLWLVTNFAALAPVFVYSMVDAGISGAGGAAIRKQRQLRAGTGTGGMEPDDFPGWLLHRPGRDARCGYWRAIRLH
jgi:type IV secretory pathway TrbL component